MNDSLLPQDGETNETANKVFVNLADTDSTTGLPSLHQAPASGLHAPTKSKVDNQMLIAGLVLLAGVGSVYGMRYMGMAAGLDENVVTVDYTSDSGNPESTKRFTEVMSALEDSAHVMQFGEGMVLPKRPFTMDDSSGDDYAATPGMSDEQRMVLQRQREFENAKMTHEGRIAAELQSFKVQGVIGGKRPAARVSGQAVRVGMELGDYFKVVEITGRTVVVEAEGARYELAMGQEAQLVD